MAYIKQTHESYINDSDMINAMSYICDLNKCKNCIYVGLKYSDIDYINRTISIERQLGRAVNTKKEDFAPKTFTKQEIKLKTSSSRRELPIPDYVFEAIMEERKLYEKRLSCRKKEFQDLDYICCSSYGRPLHNYMVSFANFSLKTQWNTLSPTMIDLQA